MTTVSNSFFNASSPTKVIIHGFGSSCDKVWAREMRLSFLAVVSLDSKKGVLIVAQEDCNVICVDWAAGAVDPNYVRAAVNTRLVGKQVIWQVFHLKPHWASRWLCSSRQSTLSLGTSTTTPIWLGSPLVLMCLASLGRN